MLFMSACSGNGGNNGSAGQTGEGNADDEKLGPATFHMYTYNGDDASKERNQYAIEQIKKVMPEITVEIENMDSGDPAYTKMKTYIAASDVPQFYAVQKVYIDALISTGQIGDLGPYAESSGFAADAYPAAVKLGTYDGKLYAFPGIALSYAMIYYNKQIFKDNGIEQPVTYDDFLAAVKKLRANGIDPIGVMGKDKWPFGMLLDILATRFDPNASENVLSGKAKFTDEAYLKAAERVQELAKAGAFPKDAMSVDYATAVENFTSGKTAMLINGSWAFTEIGAKMGYDNFGYLYFPVNDASQFEESKKHWAGGDGSPVGWSFNPKKFKTEAEKERAAKFLYYWAKFTAEKYVLGGNPVVTMKVDATPEGGFPDVIKQWQTDFANIETSPVYIQWNVPSIISDTFNNGLQMLATGMYEPAQFAADMQKALDEASK